MLILIFNLIFYFNILFFSLSSSFYFNLETVAELIAAQAITGNIHQWRKVL